MQNLYYQTNAISNSAGMADVLQGNLDVGDFVLGCLEYDIPKGVDYYMTLSCVGDAIVVTGHASADICGECVRCLEPAQMHIESDIEGYWALSEESDLEGMEEDEYDIVPEGGEIDLSGDVLAAIIVEVPQTFLCSEECKGLCPKCGCNRNEEECNCADEVDDMNPFAVLKDFFADSEDSEN